MLTTCHCRRMTRGSILPLPWGRRAPPVMIHVKKCKGVRFPGPRISPVCILPAPVGQQDIYPEGGKSCLLMDLMVLTAVPSMATRGQHKTPNHLRLPDTQRGRRSFWAIFWKLPESPSPAPSAVVTIPFLVCLGVLPIPSLHPWCLCFFLWLCAPLANL